MSLGTMWLVALALAGIATAVAIEIVDHWTKDE